MLVQLLVVCQAGTRPVSGTWATHLWHMSGSRLHRAESRRAASAIPSAAESGQPATVVRIPDHYPPTPIPGVLAKELDEAAPSMSTARKLVRKGIVLVNGARAHCDTAVKGGDEVVVLPRRTQRRGTRGGGTAADPWAATGASPACTGLFSTSRDNLGVILGGSGRAAMVWDCLRAGKDPLHDPSVTDKTQGLMVLAGLSVSKVGTRLHTKAARDGTAKLLLKLADGMEVETVLIPWKDRNRTTICVSSQVGCAQACTFCATGRMGRLRSLSAEEILVQAFYGRQTVRELGMPPLEGVVFMGMGEPADNAREVVAAANVLGDDKRFRFSKARITISTVAPNPESFGELARAGCVLAWSVHAAEDGLRKRLVPTTKHSMVELREALQTTLLSLPRNSRQVMIEVVLIQGVNSRLEHAQQMLSFLEPLHSATRHAKVMVDLIPYNAVDHVSYTKPTHDEVTLYQGVLRAGGIFTFVRTTRGDDEDAACGQLATRRLRPTIAGSDYQIISERFSEESGMGR